MGNSASSMANLILEAYPIDKADATRLQRSKEERQSFWALSQLIF